MNNKNITRILALSTIFFALLFALTLLDNIVKKQRIQRIQEHYLLTEQEIQEHYLLTEQQAHTLCPYILIGQQWVHSVSEMPEEYVQSSMRFAHIDSRLACLLIRLPESSNGYSRVLTTNTIDK